MTNDAIGKGGKNMPDMRADELLREQQAVMGNYLHILELRAEIEGIKLQSIIN